MAHARSDPHEEGHDVAWEADDVPNRRGVFVDDCFGRRVTGDDVVYAGVCCLRKRLDRRKETRVEHGTGNERHRCN